MKKKLLLALLLIALSVRPVAAQTCTGWSNQLVPMDYESITVSTAAIGFTASKIATTNYKAAYAYFTVETADGRYRVDGTNPSSSEGHVFTHDTAGYYVCGVTAVANFKAIRSGGSDATLKVTYWRGN